jgi:hypothetical protein
MEHLADGIMDNGRISIETTPANASVIYAFSEGGKFKNQQMQVSHGLINPNREIKLLSMDIMILTLVFHL